MYIVKHVDENTGNQEVYFSVSDNSNDIRLLTDIKFFIRYSNRLYVLMNNHTKIPITRKQELLLSYCMREELYPDEYYFKSQEYNIDDDVDLL